MRTGPLHRWLARTAALVSVLGAAAVHAETPARSGNSTGPVIGAHKEAAIQALVRPFDDGRAVAPQWHLGDIAIRAAEIDIEVNGPGRQARIALNFLPPGKLEGLHSQSFSLSVDPPTDATVVAPLLAAIQRNDHGDLWQAPEADTSPDRLEQHRANGGTSPVLPAPWPTWLTLAYVLLWSFHAAARALAAHGKQLLRSRDAWAVLAVLAAFLALLLVFPEWTPLHDHNSFVVRQDCGYWRDCRDPRAAWLLPSLQAYGVFLHLAPYRLAEATQLGLLFSVASLLVFYGFVRALFTRFRHPEAGRRVALLALALVALHPLFVRLAVGGTLWPYQLTMFWASGWVLLIAIRTQRLSAWLAAMGFFALAILGNLVFAVLLPLLILAPACWRRAGPMRLRLPILVAVGLFAAWVGQVIVGDFSQWLHRDLVGATRLGSGVLTMAFSAVKRQFYFNPRLTPLPLGLLLVVAVLSVRRRNLQAILPLAYAYCATDLVLANQVDLADGYPTRFIHGMSSLYFQGLIAAVGWEIAARHLPWHQARRWFSAILTAVCLLLVPFASESMDFLGIHRPVATELALLSRAFPHLPDHQTLVIAPTVLAKLSPQCPSDPVEAFFPTGEYRYVMAQRRQVPKVEELDALLADPPPPQALETMLVYVGSSLQTFLTCEIQQGAVPPSLAQPLLRRLLEAYDLEPVIEMSLPTTNAAKAVMRLAADRVPAVRIGFYRLHARTGTPRTFGHAPDPDWPPDPPRPLWWPLAPILALLLTAFAYSRMGPAPLHVGPRQLLLALGTSLLALASLEGAVRLFALDDRIMARGLYFQSADLSVHRVSADPFLHYELKPNSTYQTQAQSGLHYAVRVDPFGARYPTHRLETSPDTRRILVFGGSTAYGGNVNDDETLPAALEARLNQQQVAHKTWQVWNFATSAYTLAQAAHAARDKLRTLSPDLIVVQLHNTGRRPYLLPANGDLLSALPPQEQRTTAFYREQFPDFDGELHAWAMAHVALYRCFVAWSPAILPPDSPSLPGAESDALGVSETRALLQEADARHVPVVFLAIPADRHGVPPEVQSVISADLEVDLYQPDQPAPFYAVHPPAPFLAQYAVALHAALAQKGLLH